MQLSKMHYEKLLAAAAHAKAETARAETKWPTCSRCLAIASQKYRMRLKRGKDAA